MLQKKKPNPPQILNHPYVILRIRGSGSGKTNSLFNLIIHQPNIDRISVFAKDPYEGKYQLLINKRESTGLKHINNFKGSIECSNEMVFL